MESETSPASAPIGEGQVNALFQARSNLSIDSATSEGSTLHTPSTPYLRDIKDPLVSHHTQLSPTCAYLSS